MLRLSIVQDDMLIRDERALKFLRSKVNPQTNRAEVNINELAQHLHCHRNTAATIVHRLQGLELVKIHASRGRGGAEIEVFHAFD